MRILEDSLQQDLLYQLSTGDETAFNALYKAYSRPLYIRVVNLLKSKEDAEEIIQEIFVKLWEGRHTLTQIKSFQSYVFTIAHNEVYSYFRKVGTNKAMLERLILNTAEHFIDGNALLENKGVAKIIEQAMDQLTPQCKQVFKLCKLEGRTHKETAEIMGISLPTVNSHMTIALKSVREYIVKNQDFVILLISTYAVSTLLS